MACACGVAACARCGVCGVEGEVASGSPAAPSRAQRDGVGSSLHVTDFRAGELGDAGRGVQDIWHRVARAPPSTKLAEWRLALALHPDRKKVDWFLYGLEHGFKLGVSGVEPSVAPAVSADVANSSAFEAPDVIDRWLEEELQARRVAGPFPSLPDLGGVVYVSPLGLAPKSVPLGAPAKWRTTTDLSRAGVNRLIADDTASISYVQYADIARAWGRLPDSAHGVVFDIEAAYRQLPIAPEDYRFCVFAWGGQFYVDTRLCFGVRSGPNLYDVFGELLAWVVMQHIASPDAELTRLLDDNAIVGPSRAEATRYLEVARSVCGSLGVPLAPGKIQSASQRLLFLGFEWFLGPAKRVSLPDPKVLKLRGLIEWLSQVGLQLSLKDLQSATGFLVFCAAVVPGGRTFLQELFDLQASWERTLPGVRHASSFSQLSAGARADVAWWQELLSAASLAPSGEGGPSSWCSVPLSWMAGVRLPSGAEVDIFTDASGSGFGGHMGPRFFHGMWPPGMRLGSSGSSTAFLELCAVSFALRLWGPAWAGRPVRVWCDNRAVCDMWRKGASRSRRSMRVLRGLVAWVAHWGIQLHIEWIPTEANVIADPLSRQVVVTHPGLLFRDFVPEAWLAQLV